MGIALALATAPAASADERLRAYDARINTGAQLEQLAKAGFDVHEGRSEGVIEIIGTASQARALSKKGIDLTERTGAPASRPGTRAQQPDGSWEVWRPYFDDEYVGMEGDAERETLYEELTALAAANTDIVKPVEIGRTHLDKPILALRVTKDAREPSNPDGQRPAVLYISAQHAREWITPEMTRRLLHLFVDNYGRTGAALGTDGQPIEGIDSSELTQLVNTRELWFVVVANPDGYDHSFTPGNRLWRKNLRDNNGDGEITNLDGVDLNRNFPEHWGYDDEGSSPEPTSDTYRGPSAASEPETQAMMRLFKRSGAEFLVNYHSAAELLLYGIGWQVQTFAADDPIARALAGTDDDPAVKGAEPGAPDPYDPDVSSELYVTNGDTDDTAYERYDMISYTPEMDVADPDRGGGNSGFEFQDVEADVQQSFEKNIQFALDQARSADDPDDPESHLGNEVPDFEIDPFLVSHGDPQVVQINAKRELGPVRVHWTINGHGERSAAAPEWGGGERYGGEGVYFHRVRGVVTGTKPGDEVKVWFEAGGKRSQSFTYDVKKDTGNPVLIMAAEDYSGKGNTQEPSEDGPTEGPAYLSYYENALKANGIGYDVYDVDAEGRTAPDALGVLSHYKAVIWYTGNDLFIREPGAPGATGTSKLANDEILEVRDYLNEGGKLFYTGKYAAYGQQTGFEFNPQGQPPYCKASDTSPGTVTNCVPLSNDFLQYWLGAYVHIDAAATKEDVSTLAMSFAGGPFGSDAIELNGGDSADNQDHVYSMVTTSSILDNPVFASQRAVLFNRVPAFDPFTGTKYAAALSDDEGWQRLSRTIDLTGATAADMQFKISYDTEADYDFVIVEAHEVGKDDWTTLPDENGHTLNADVEDDHSVGSSCDINWDELHPFLVHYQTNPSKSEEAEDADCTPTGTTGTWSGATGNSSGWQDWKIDLSAYAGKKVEISISYVQDFAVSGLGVFVDDWSLTKNGAVAEQTSFEDGLGGFTAAPAPDATSALGTQKSWTSSTSVGFVEGPGVLTPDSVYFGFGFEGIQTGGQRKEVMKDVMTYLGVIKPGGQTPPPGGGGKPNPPAGGGGGGAGGGGGGTPGGGGQPPVGQPPAVLPPRIASTVLRSSRARNVYVRLRCPASTGTMCRGQLRLQSGNLVLSQRTFTTTADRYTPVRLRLTRSAYRKLVRRGQMRASVVLLTRGADGRLRRAQRRLSVLPPRRR